MLRMSIVLALGLGSSLAGCKKDATVEPAAPTAPAPGAAAGTTGPRKVAIEAALEGYKPDRVPGKPGEQLVLVFTRTVDAACMAQLKTPDGKLIDLPKGKPVEVAVTVPQSGELGFACGMDMVFGKIVAEG